MSPLVGALAAALLAPRAGTARDRLDAASSVFALFVRGRAGPQRADDLCDASDLRSQPRSITIVTTAALPWMTGTAVNPLLRAVFLARDGHDVTLVLPWVPSRDSQKRIFAGGALFTSSAEQGAFIDAWLESQGFGDVCIRLVFYEGAYSAKFGSILPLAAITDIFSSVPELARDVCILEEPEHLTWHHPGSPWPLLFRVVIGVIHTNYIEYARTSGFFGPQRALLMLLLNIWVCRSYCHRVIKLSDAVQHFPHSVTCNVHGVRDHFLHIGRTQTIPRDRGAYFLAKVLWAKGYTELIALLRAHFTRTGVPLAVDLFGDGKDADEVAETIANDPALVLVRFTRGYADHAGEHLQHYRVCVNASVSEVVCTATAEALAMGKTVICIEHPSNAFFASFANCHTYSSPEEFSHTFEAALARDPVPLSEDDAYKLSWVAATHRFYDAAKVLPGESRLGKVDEFLASAHSAISKVYPNPGEQIRRNESAMFGDDSIMENDVAAIVGIGAARMDNIADDTLSEESVSFSDVSDTQSLS